MGVKHNNYHTNPETFNFNKGTPSHENLDLNTIRWESIINRTCSESLESIKNRKLLNNSDRIKMDNLPYSSDSHHLGTACFDYKPNTVKPLIFSYINYHTTMISHHESPSLDELKQKINKSNEMIDELMKKMKDKDSDPNNTTFTQKLPKSYNKLKISDYIIDPEECTVLFFYGDESWSKNSKDLLNKILFVANSLPFSRFVLIKVVDKLVNSHSETDRLLS